MKLSQETKEGLVVLMWTVILGVIIFLGLAILNNYYYTNINDTVIINETQMKAILTKDKGTLEKLLEKEIVSNPNWTCADYVVYYNTTLKKYNTGLNPPERNLDIRELRYVDICNGLTLCDSYHTFLVIGGYGQECILDQQEIKCISLLDVK